MILAHVTVPLIIYGIFPQFNLLALLIGANISSLDALPILLRKVPPENPIEETHAATILHTLFFFLVTGLAIFPVFGAMAAVSFMIGGFTHIFLDALDEKGRMLFYPISRKFYGPGIFTYDFWTYVTNRKIFALETTLFFISCILLISRW
ncbi:MAG: metal-dependent hydrolase [Candidatus Hadarchaeales archaeon]